MDYIVWNSQQWDGAGDVATRLLMNNFDPRCIRPFWYRGRPHISRVVGYNSQTGKPIVRNVPTMNAATLRQDEWKVMDRAVVEAAKPRLNFWNDLRAAGLATNLPNAMGTSVYQYQRQSNITGATVSMDGLRKGDSDRPLYNIEQMPIPIVHQDAFFSAREIAMSRRLGTPVDTTTLTEASEKVAEEIEKIALGVSTSFFYAGGRVYGLCNYPYRMTRVLTSPFLTDGSRNPAWSGELFKNEVIQMRRMMYDNYQFGPFMMYHSPEWDDVLDDDFNAGTSGLQSTITVRKRILEISGIGGFRAAEFLPFGTMIMLRMNSGTIQALDGMDITTVQWTEQGGMEIHFKVLAIQLPRMKSDYYGRCGVVHGVAPAVSP